MQRPSAGVGDALRTNLSGLLKGSQLVSKAACGGAGVAASPFDYEAFDLREDTRWASMAAQPRQVLPTMSESLELTAADAKALSLSAYGGELGKQQLLQLIFDAASEGKTYLEVPYFRFSDEVLDNCEQRGFWLDRSPPTMTIHWGRP